MEDGATTGLTPEQLAENNADVLAGNDPRHKAPDPGAGGAGNGGSGGQGSGGGEGESGGSQEVKLVYKDAWDQLAKDGITVNPDFLTGKFGEGVTEHQALINTIKEANKPQEVDDPFVKGYLNTPVEKRAEYVQNYNDYDRVLAMTPKDGVRWAYQQAVDDKGQRIYPDADIDAYLEKLTTIELSREWNGYKTSLAKEKEQRFNPPEPKPEEINAAIEKANTSRMAMIKPLLEEEMAMETYAGMEYTPEMKQEFSERFQQLNMINPKTGYPYFYQLLEDPKVLRDMFRAGTFLTEKRIGTFLSEFKEDFKGKTFEKLDPKPKSRSGSSGIGKPANVPEP